MSATGVPGMPCDWIRGPLAWLMLVVLGFHLLIACTHLVRPNGGPAGGVPVRFVYVDARAREVCLLGSFNQWTREKSTCLERDGETWSVTVLLPSGRHQYAFMVDGHMWKQDPGARLLEDNGFGMMNSVLIIE